jgi:hypothetical protein
MSVEPATALKVVHVPGPGIWVIRLSGVIDESFDVDEFAGKAEGVVVIDLDEVQRITSYGVRQWMRGLERLKATWVGIIRARPALVTQFNMISGFAGTAKLISLYLPYVCTQSGNSFEVLMDVRRQHATLAAHTPPPAKCPDSGSPAEFDDVPESYLSFVARQPVPVVPAVAEAQVQGPLAHGRG